MSSRFTEYKGGQFNPGQFAEWELLPMTQSIRRELAQRLFLELQHLLPSSQHFPSSWTSFVEILESHPQISLWAENPQLFSLTALIFIRTGQLPSKRVLFYREIIEAVITVREVDIVDIKLLHRILADLALWLNLIKARVFSINDLISFMNDNDREKWDDTTNLSRRIINSGVVEIVAHSTYAFRQQSFQEYLAGEALAIRLISPNQVTKEDAWNLAWSKRTYSRWIEVLRFMVGILMNNPGAYGKLEARRWIRTLLALRNEPTGDVGYLGLALALKSLVEVPEEASTDASHENIEIDLEEEFIAAWIDEWIKAAGQVRRQKKLLVMVSDIAHLHAQTLSSFVQRLAAVLKDENSSILVRRAIAELIEKMRMQSSHERIRLLLYNENISAALSKQLSTPLSHEDALGTSEEQVRKQAIQLMRQTHSDILLKMIVEDRELMKKSTSTIELNSPERLFLPETMKRVEASPLLLEQLKQLLESPHWQVQIVALQFYGELRRNIPDALIRLMLELRLHSPYKVVREVADDTLAEILSLETGIEDD